MAARGRQYWGRPSWRRELLFDSAALETAVPLSIFAFCTCSWGGKAWLLGCSFFLSLNISSVFLKGHSFRAACRHDELINK